MNIKEIRELERNATPGPWGSDIGNFERPQDAAFMDAARIAIPMLLDKLELCRRGLDDIVASGVQSDYAEDIIKKVFGKD